MTSTAEQRERARLAQQRSKARKRGEDVPNLRPWVVYGLSFADRFWAKVHKSDGCWLWTAGLDHRGYGRFRTKTTTRGAHRVAWELVNGGHPCVRGPLPQKIFACHRCDVNYTPDDWTWRRCVRPDHLFLGDHDANMADMVAKGRAKGGHPERLPQGEFHISRTHPELFRGEQNNAARLTDDVVRALRAQHLIARTGRQRVPRGWLQAMALRYGVKEATITHAISGYTWGHVL
jgi:hypothetical protein